MPRFLKALLVIACLIPAIGWSQEQSAAEKPVNSLTPAMLPYFGKECPKEYEMLKTINVLRTQVDPATIKVLPDHHLLLTTTDKRELNIDWITVTGDVDELNTMGQNKRFWLVHVTRTKTLSYLMVLKPTSDNRCVVVADKDLLQVQP